VDIDSINPTRLREPFRNHAATMPVAHFRNQTATIEKWACNHRATIRNHHAAKSLQPPQPVSKAPVRGCAWLIEGKEASHTPHWRSKRENVGAALPRYVVY
jgi:hypothetical protein